MVVVLEHRLQKNKGRILLSKNAKLLGCKVDRVAKKALKPHIGGIVMNEVVYL